MKENKNRSLGRPRSSEQKQPTNQIILKAATELFLSNGYQEVSVDDVAKKADVTKATVYYYYASKADLFTETMVQMMVRIREHMQGILFNKKAPLRTRLQQVAEAHLRATVEIDMESFMRETKNALSDQQVKKVQEAEEKMYETLEQTFEDAMNDGEISKINTRFAAHSYIALMKVGNYRDSENKAIFSTIEETAEQLTEFFWNGLIMVSCTSGE